MPGREQEFAAYKAQTKAYEQQLEEFAQAVKGGAVPASPQQPVIDEERRILADTRFGEYQLGSARMHARARMRSRTNGLVRTQRTRAYTSSHLDAHMHMRDPTRTTAHRPVRRAPSPQPHPGPRRYVPGLPGAQRGCGQVSTHTARADARTYNE